MVLVLIETRGSEIEASSQNRGYLLPRQGSSAWSCILTRRARFEVALLSPVPKGRNRTRATSKRASEGSEALPSLARFEVALSVLRPEGAATNQPRASPWDPGDHPPSPALKGRHTEAGAGKERACTALSGLAIGGNPHRPRAVPWADLWLPLRGEISQAPLQNARARGMPPDPRSRVGLVW